MSKAAKTFLILTVCLVVLGGAVFCLAMAANRWDFGRLGGKLETNTYDVSSDFHAIAVRCSTEDVDFRLSDDGTCRVVCAEREDEKHLVYVQDDTLVIEREDNREWYEHVSLFTSGSPSITVYLPRAEYVSLSVEANTGDVTVPKDLLFGTAEIRLDTGDVDFRASSKGLLRIRTDTGDIHVDGVTAGEIDLSVDTGRVEVFSASCTGSVSVTVDTGKVFLTDVSCASFTSTGNTGDLTLKNVAASDSVSIVRSTGDVTFDRCDAADLVVETDTGDVTGSLLTPKIFVTSSDTGRVDVPESLTGGRCKITTDTGDIRITIAGA